MCVRLRCAHVDTASGASANGIDNASAEWELVLALRLLRRVLNGDGLAALHHRFLSFLFCMPAECILLAKAAKAAKTMAQQLVALG